MHKCPKCDSLTDHRIPRGILTKILLPFLNLKKYYCFRCLRSFYIVDRKESVFPLINSLQTATLEPTYLICWMNCIPVNTLSGIKKQQSSIFLVTGLNKNGFKEILGLWINQKPADLFWPQVIANIKQRGVTDILIASSDFSDRVKKKFSKYFPGSMALFSFNRQITNSLKHISSKHRPGFHKDIKAVYQAPDSDTALKQLDAFSDKWRGEYDFLVTFWEQNWPELHIYFTYSEKIRSLILLEDMLKMIDLTVDKLYKTPLHRPDEQNLLKEVEESVSRIQEKNSLPIKQWGKLMNDFELKFGKLWDF